MKRKTMNDNPEHPEPPDEPAGSESGALIEPSEEAVLRLERELADMKEKYLRLAAEYDNFKRRSAKDRTDLWQRAQADLVQRLVDALDDLARFAHVDPAQTDAKTLHDGVDMVERKTWKALEAAGVTRGALYHHFAGKTELFAAVYEEVERQHANGKLTVRERIDRLLDAGSFREVGTIAGSARYEGTQLVEFVPANQVAGHGTIDSRPIAVVGDDFTVRGGAADASVYEKLLYPERLAHDLRMPIVRLVDGTGVALAERLRRTAPGTRVVMLTAVESIESVIDALVAGARAWLPKTVDTAHLVQVIRGVHAGGAWLSPGLLGKVIPLLLTRALFPPPDPLAVLTQREREVLGCMVEGLSRPEIAAHLNMSGNTVRTHTQNLIGKLGAHSSLEAMTLAMRSGRFAISE